MALCSDLTTTEPQNAPFKATQLWREIITSFRAGMPRRKKRVKIRVSEECFTGHEAVEWLHFYLQTSSNFGSVSREQVLKLLQKFLDSDVIRDARGKSSKFDEEGSTLYCFVTEPGPLNFVEDMDTSSCHSSPRRPKSPLGKHLRPAPAIIVENAEGDSNQEMCGDDTLFMNAYAFLSDSMNQCMSDTHTENVKMSMKSDSKTKMGGDERSTMVQLEDSNETASGGSPVKKCRSDTFIASRITLHRHHHSDSISLNGDKSPGVSPSHSTSGVDVSDVVQLSPAQVAGVWKELTLNRLLQLVELETLEGVLAYDAVDGKNIAKNFGPLRITARRSMLATRASSTSGKSRSVRGRRGGGRGHSEAGGVTTSSSGGVGSTHPNWLNRRFGLRLSRVQPVPVPSPPPAMNVHTSLYRSRSNNKLHPSSSSSTTTISPSSSMTSLTLHHKLRHSIKHRSSRSGGESSDERTTTSSTAAYLPPKSLSSSSPCLAAAGKKEGGRESVMDVPHWVVLAMKCLAKWPDGCTEEFVGDMAVYCGFERDVLKSLVQYFNSLSDPLISPKLYDLHMAVLSLVKAGKPSAVDALQLCSLLLPQTNRTRLHRVLRLIHKASSNRQLVLSKTRSNRDVLLEHFSSIVLKQESHNVSPLHLPAAFQKSSSESSADGGGSGGGVAKSEEEKESLKRLVGFMSQHYQQIFKIPDNLRREVQKRLDLISSGKVGSPVQETRAFCHRVSSAEYERQRQSGSNSALIELLDSIVADTSVSAKVKKQRLKQFQKAYPEIYASRAVMSGVTHGHPATTPTTLALGKRSSMPNLLALDASSADSAPPTSTTTIPSSRSSSSCSMFSAGKKAGKGKGGKGRTLSKLATNYYSTDCLASPTANKPVLR